MKKLIMVVALMALLASHVYAGQVERTIIDAESISVDQPYIEADAGVKGSSRVAFFITNDSSKTTEGVTTDVTVQISIDGVNWLDARFFDFAGGSTLQTTETVGQAGQGDGNDYMWFDNTMPLSRIKISFGLDATAEGELGTAEYNKITVTLIETK